MSKARHCSINNRYHFWYFFFSNLKDQILNPNTFVIIGEINSCELCHKTEKCTNVPVLTAKKKQKFLLNQKQTDQYIAKNVLPKNTKSRRFRLVSFD